MLHEEDYLTSSDGLRLYRQSWLPDGPPKAVVVLVHGFTEHSGRYAPVAEELNRHGHAVDAIDLRGHGRSEGARTSIRSFDQYLADSRALLDFTARRRPGCPRILFGHSLGGLIAARWAIEDGQADVRGVVLSGPGLRVARNVFPWLRQLTPALNLLLPRLRLVRMGCRNLSRDDSAVEQFRSDPLGCHGRFPVRTAAEIMRAGRQTLEKAERLRRPLLILQGTGDHVVDVDAVGEFFRRASSADKTLKLYDGFYHELFTDPDRRQVLDDLLAWLQSHAS